MFRIKLHELVTIYKIKAAVLGETKVISQVEGDNLDFMSVKLTNDSRT